MDTTTGDVVAIKQIGLAGASQENLAGVMGEIELLKTLNHKNIVKYVGSFKTRSHLYIILEYMENGALSSVIKPNRFGVFPETLVAIYIAQACWQLLGAHGASVPQLGALCPLQTRVAPGTVVPARCGIMMTAVCALNLPACTARAAATAVAAF
jgi:hypothetical protein